MRSPARGVSSPPLAISRTAGSWRRRSRARTTPAFYAAEAALAELGETRSKHSGVVSAVGELLVKPGELAPRDGRLLRSLFDRRAGADYDIDDEPSAQDAADAIADAEAVVDAIGTWLASRR